MADDDPDAPLPRTNTSPTGLDSADPVRNFSLSVDERIRALTIGVPSWAARKRRIEDTEERHVADLVELHDKLVKKRKTPTEIEAALVNAANAINLVKLNELVRTHNRYYPIEANLPMDRKTGSYLVYGREWLPEPPYTAERILRLAQGFLAHRDDGE